MDFDRLFIDNVPFPYFILDQELNVLKKSNLAQRSFVQVDAFLKLIDFQYQQDAISFFKNDTELEFIEVPMDGNANKQFYQIYKAMDLYLNFHVFCVPIKTELANVKEMISKVERKLFRFNQDLREKRDYLEKTVEEMRGAAQTVDHHHNIENLAAGIAHEIRNPLTTVKGFLQLLKPHLKELGKEQYAEVALEEINRANDIIFEFLNAAKPQTDVSKDSSLNKLVQDIVILYESEAILRNIEMITSLSSFDVSIPIAPKQLKQVLINILKNAMEAIDESLDSNRIISISTIINSGNASIHISDSGCGMTNEVLNHLFMPFYSTKEKGTGIGLSMCKKIIEENGGTIHVESEVHKGTTFRITFPIQAIVPPSKNLPSQ
ncbi:ATP-binding protein [Bacillota bacterium Lsc_1132]